MYFNQGHPIDQLYCLRKLKLPRGATLADDILEAWPDLRHLELQDVGIMQDVTKLPRATAYKPGRSIEAFLAQLQQLTQLAYLHLTLDGFGASPSSLAGLTASSSTLQHLHLEWRDIPQEGWEAIFPPGLHMPRLEMLVLQETKEKHLQVIPILNQSPTLDATALHRLANCCASSLRSLKLEWCPGRQPACVGLDSQARFTSLTSLSLGCLIFGRVKCKLLQANLRGLQVLELLPPSWMLVQGGAWLQVTSTVRLLVGSSEQKF